MENDLAKQIKRLENIERWLGMGTNEDVIRSRIIDLDVLLRIFDAVNGTAYSETFYEWVLSTQIVNAQAAREVENKICGDVFTYLNDSLDTRQETEEERKLRLEQEAKIEELKTKIATFVTPQKEEPIVEEVVHKINVEPIMPTQPVPRKIIVK